MLPLQERLEHVPVMDVTAGAFSLTMTEVIGDEERANHIGWMASIL